MSAYEEYRKGVEKYITDNRATIEETKKQASDTIFPQHILWAKEVCNELKTEDAKTLRIGEEFFFTEKLVNRLMLYAFLKGQRDIDIRSHKRGWNECRRDVAQKLGYADDDEEQNLHITQQAKPGIKTTGYWPER